MVEICEWETSNQLYLTRGVKYLKFPVHMAKDTPSLT